MGANKGLTHNITLLKQALWFIAREGDKALPEFARAKGTRADSIRYAIKVARKAGRL